MRVAIIGAGASGLACAQVLIKNGVNPDIYEKQSRLGSMHNHIGCMMRMFNRDFKDPLNYLDNKYGIKIKSAVRLTEIVMASPQKEIDVKHSKLGYMFSRGEQLNSLEQQLGSSFSSRIIFNTYGEAQKLKKFYDYVIVATGDGTEAKETGEWIEKMTIRTRSAVVLGNFKPGYIKMWLNTRYSGHCYCYLTACRAKQANLVLTLDGGSENDLEYCWKTFLFEEGLNLKITETRDTEFLIGHPKNLLKENIIFTGNSAGFTDDFLGFGVLNAVESGALAAISVLKGLYYPDLVKPIIKNIEDLHQYRIALSTMDNQAYNRIISFLSAPGIRRIVYKNRFFRIKYTIGAVKLYNKLKGRL